MPECRYDVDTGGDDDMRTVVKKWGNSASVRIPAAVMQAAHLDLDEAVDVCEESGASSSSRRSAGNTIWGSL